MQNRETTKSIGAELKAQVIILGTFVAFIWILEIVDSLLFAGSLDALGIRPRTAAGLWGIPFAPFLHVGLRHVAANTGPFLVLGWLVMMRHRHHFFAVTAVTAVVSGLGVWLIGPSNSVHVGSSGLIFGYFGFLLLRGYFERRLSSIMWAIIVALLYGGLILGALPQGSAISWQGHLFGFLGGGLTAYWLAERSAPKDAFTNEEGNN